MRTQFRAALWSATLIFLTAGYFQHIHQGWNVASRFDLTLALAEHGTFRIDDYHDHGWTFTNDKAFFEGHFYSDKGAVTSLAAVPIVWAYRQVDVWSGVPFHSEHALWVATWIVVGGSAAALAALLTLVLARRGLSPRRAAACSVLWISATPLLPFAFVFYDYLPACALIAGSFLAAEPAWRDEAGCSPWRLFVAGFLGGLACWTLNTVGITMLTLTALIAVGVLRLGRSGASLARGWPWVTGGLAGAAGFFIYNYVIFRSILPGYAYEADPFFRESMATGLMGAGWPRLLVVWLQTLHPFQGLFLWFPATALATAGCLLMVAREHRAARSESIVVLFSFVLFLTYSSGYYTWWGGTGYVARHVIPALPLLALGLIPWVKSAKAAPSIWILLTVGALFSLTLAAVDPQFPLPGSQDAFLHPETVRRWPVPILQMQRIFWAGASQWDSGVALWNLGRQAGIEGPPSLLPLLGIWTGAFVVLPNWLHDSGDAVQNTTSRLWKAVTATCAAWVIGVTVMWVLAKPLPIVNVRWVDNVPTATRAETERALSLIPRGVDQTATGRYFLNSADNDILKRIVQHPLVEDTAFIDRGSYVLDHPRYERMWIGDRFRKPWLTWSFYAAILGGMLAAVILRLQA